MSMRNFTAQIILSVQQSELLETVPVKSSEAILRFVEESKDLYSRFNAACLQGFNTKNQHSNYFYSRLLEYSTIHAARGKDFDV